ncbi:MAG: membrane protein insertase YidC [Rhodospirillaceae bacterium]|jgi:YidC/Oxa1 family membrane protein insertase|nr:membrane protein insertase YidC [Rhodospirillaceae bacterium]MBT6119613.1 membrane protein insertase YidC [Rhodospirillaceae bacterium]
MDQRNLFLAIGVTLAIIIAWTMLYEEPRVREQQAQVAAQPADSPTVRPTVPGAATTGQRASAPAATREETLAETPRLAIDTPRLKGSVALRGGYLDDLILSDYHETTDPESPPITLLSPVGTEHPYFAEFGWVATSGDPALPDRDTLWQADSDTLRVDQPVTLSWDNGAGLIFKRILSVDANYLFTVSQVIENTGGESVSLAPYGLVSRWDTPEVQSFYILHEGPIGAFEGVLEEEDYDDVKEDGAFTFKSSAEKPGGWIGITDKYWLVALMPDQQAQLEGKIRYVGDDRRDKYQTDFVRLDVPAIAPGQTVEITTHIFAGAKEVKLIDDYAELLEVVRFDRAVGFRWLYFLAKPMFYVLDYFYGVVGNFGVAILLLTVVIKLLFFPLANKSYRAMGRMKALQPKVTELRERLGDDKQKLHQELMELYKREKANPMAGCWPMLIQIPVFFALYEVLFITIEMRHSPFFGWITDLSAPDPTTIFNAFGLIPWDPPSMLMIGAWPLLMGISMFLQQKINPQPADPMQAKIMMSLPFVFTFILASFPAGLVVYWAWNNTLSIAQQWVIMKRAAAAGLPGSHGRHADKSGKKGETGQGAGVKGLIENLMKKRKKDGR